ncbi:broad-complex core protein isoforms 1/2/3/4/5 isoform X1 [Aedes albopictus]|uniref:BTB domain-containing protein n=1 Tax=Aedes albopictus TaxID=7160 RepID=A0ABM1YG57_AEDAL|nr:broad-complex core protein isoforms 1/2/3/4/5-like isoform X1 [Aedes albopictus]
MDEFALCWNNFADNIASGFQKLYDLGDLVDVTIACDGKLLKAHKIVLAICSPYFQEMFMSNPCKHPIIVLKDVSVNVMQELLQFMYQGEVNVKHSELQCFMKIAETLQIKGLTASHKNERSPTPSSGLTPAPAHRASSTSQLDPSKLNSYLAAAAKESLKRAAESTPEAFPGLHYPIKKSIKRSTDSIDQDSNSDCMDNLSSDEAFIPASPQISMIEQSPSAVAPSARQFDLSNVKREAGGDSVSSPQQSPTNLATSAAAMGAAAAAASAAAAMKLGFSSTPTSASAAAAALHPMFGGFDHNNSSFSGIATSLASISGNGSGNNGAVAIAGGTPGGPGGSAGGLKLASMDYSTDYGSDYGKGGIPPGHMDIPAGPSITMLSSTSLLHNNCIFNRNNTVATQQGLKTYWLCKSYRVSMCRARCITHHGQVISSTGVHNHQPHMKAPHEFPHQPPQPPLPPPNLSQPVAPPPQPQEPQSIHPPLNNGAYHEYHPNTHSQPVSNHAVMGPPSHYDPNPFPMHHQPAPYPEMPPYHHNPHHHHHHPPHNPYQHPPYVNPPPMPPPQSPAMILPPSGESHPPQQPQMPAQSGPPPPPLPEPEVPPDIKLTQLEPMVPSSVGSAPAGSSSCIPDEQQHEQLELKTEQLS